MKYEAVEVELRTLLTLVLDGEWWPSSRFNRFILWETVPGTHDERSSSDLVWLL
jgi:hypothetical protein